MSLLYVVILLGLLVPVGVLLGGENGPLSRWFYVDLEGVYAEWLVWLPAAMLIVGQVALLALSVDTSQKRLKPRSRVIQSAVVTSMLFMLLTVAAIFSAGVAIYADGFFDKLPNNVAWIFAAFGAIWVLWAVVFYLYLRGRTEITQTVVSWLLRGSVLELLIAVPSHVMVRRRQDCSAPVATSFGITTGIAIMLLSFGPGVLLLYKKRMESYRATAQKRNVPVP